MKPAWRGLIALLALLNLSPAPAAPMLPPPFLGGPPGAAQLRALVVQRHQARTLLYREALEELRRNPAIVDVRDCAPDESVEALCLPPAVAGGVPLAIARQPIGRRLALLIGNTHYRAPIPALVTPQHDVERIAAMLQSRLQFEVRILRDATKADMVRAVARLAREVTAADGVFVYYAGHGYLLDDTGMGYWIPVDGSVHTAVQWLSNADIAKLLRAIPARQILLVSDSCFSGTLAREHSTALHFTGETQPFLSRRSVLALSSGDEEPVSDEGKQGHSVFAWHFLRLLDQLGRTTVGHDLYLRVRSAVVADYPQTPQYGTVPAAGHEPGGEFLFEPVRPPP